MRDSSSSCPPHSYTGEDTLELYLHGGPAVITHAISTLTSEPGVRLAEPGEFTRRAFEAGKIDLTEAEGVADIIEAETNAQKAQALRQLTGGLTEQYDQWRADLTGILALIEVVVDFPDEEDAPEETTAPVIRKLTRLIHEIEEALGDRGSERRSGMDFASPLSARRMRESRPCSTALPDATRRL